MEFIVGATAAGTSICLNTRMANRHGLIAGATGTGKTVTLRTLAESFSRAGVPVFTADVKGDLASMAIPGEPNPAFDERRKRAGVEDVAMRGCPVVLWDVFGLNGLPLRTTVSEMGPLLLARLLDLNDTQAGVLQIVFSLADDQGLLLLDLKDLRALVQWVGENAAEIKNQYGNVSSATIGAIQRGLLTLEEAGAGKFFGEPGLKIEHLMQRDFSGQGVIGILDAGTLISNPRIYTTFLLWLLSELFEELPEVGDLEQPKLVFFFDEAHLLFENAPRALLEKVEQVVRLIRSKGVGVYFATQNPTDLPDSILGQLGNRVQHALRAFSASDQKAVRAAAQTFRANPALDTEKVITELKVGEALTSFLDSEGIPHPVERTLILPPQSRLGAIAPQERGQIIGRSPLKGVYEKTIDRESAYEVIQSRLRAGAEGAAAPGRPASSRPSAVDRRTTHPAAGSASRRQGPLDAFVVSAARAVGSQVGRQILRGIMGSILGGGRR